MPARKVYKSNGNSKDRTPPKYRYEDELDTQPTNSIDSELEEILKSLITLRLTENNEYILNTVDIDRALQAIKAKYISRKEVEEAFNQLEELTHNGRGTILWEMDTLAENLTKLRAKLLPPTKGGNDE